MEATAPRRQPLASFMLAIVLATAPRGFPLKFNNIQCDKKSTMEKLLAKYTTENVAATSIMVSPLQTFCQPMWYMCPIRGTSCKYLVIKYGITSS